MKNLQKNGASTVKRICFWAGMGIALVGLIVLTLALSSSFQVEPTGFIAAIALLTLFKARFRHWERCFLGGKDESNVTAALKSLPNDYVLLTDLVLPDYSGRVDHFLIGPNGLFVIETKNYSGYVRCDQDQWAVKTHRIKSLSKQVKRNTISVRSAIAGLYAARGTRIPYVVPLLVFMNPQARLRLFRPTVAVLRLEELAEFIRDYAAKGPISHEERRIIIHHLMSSNFEAGDLVDQGTITRAHLRKVK
jgi:hypothetical protein